MAKLTMPISLLPIMGWKYLRHLTPSDAAKLTNGNTDKFCNKDYWPLNLPSGVNHVEDIPAGTKAVYYHDRSWRLVEKT